MTPRSAGRRAWEALAAFALALAAPRAGFSAEPPERPAIVLIVPGGSRTMARDPTVNAVRAQLVDLPIRLVLAEAAPIDADMRGRIDNAGARAQREDALGAFFLDTDREGDLLLCLVDSKGARVLVRRVRFKPGGEVAAAEEIAVIARSTTQALLEGGEIGVRPLNTGATSAATSSAPPARPARCARRASPRTERAAPAPARGEVRQKSDRESTPPARFEVRAGYVGAVYSADSLWQSGFGLAVAWSPDARASLGIGYAFFVPGTIRISGAVARIFRHPFEVFGGYELGTGALSARMEVTLIADRSIRKTVELGAGLRPTPEEGRWFFGVSPRARALVRLRPELRVYIGPGLDIAVNSFSYVVDAAEGSIRSAPYALRPRFDTGIEVDL